VLLLVAVLFLWRTPDNPPGFHRDEASIALSATAISESLRDEDGALFPLYFESFMDYKSPLFVYGLAGVFSVTGPSTTAARYFAGAAVVCAVLLVGLLAWRRSRDAAVVIAAVLLAASTPWLYELGR
jgi:4-amino-4-deoxy-L-arabinose transferase-like glycosyltransferase